MVAIAIKYKVDSFKGALAIAASDTVDLASPVSAIYVGVAGAIKVIMANGETATFSNVPVGVFPIAVTRVFSTGTAATGLIGLK